MTKKRRLTFSVCIYVAALLVAVYGAGFSWRQALIGGVALLIWQSADEMFKAAYAKPPFTRFQFRLGIEHLGRALVAAGLYGDELEAAAGAIYAGMTGKGWIIFTWLEPDLFYVNTTDRFSSTLEVSIDLPAFGARLPEREFQLADMIEMQSSAKGYELVLLSREQRYGRSGSGDKGIVLLLLPFAFLRSMQTTDPSESNRIIKEALTAAGYTYDSDPEVRQAWSYRNQYGSLRWWNV